MSATLSSFVGDRQTTTGRAIRVYRALVDHRCVRCRRTIRIGDQFTRTGVGNGSSASGPCCARCQRFA